MKKHHISLSAKEVVALLMEETIETNNYKINCKDSCLAVIGKFSEAFLNQKKLREPDSYLARNAKKLL